MESRRRLVSLFTTASKPIQNTKNLAMQVEKTRFRFQEVLASTRGKTMRFRQRVLYEYESDFLCLSLNEWNPQNNETIIYFSEAEK